MAVRHRVGERDAEGDPVGHALADAPAAAFGPEVPVTLKLATDPEEDAAALFARVETARGVGDGG